MNDDSYQYSLMACQEAVKALAEAIDVARVRQAMVQSQNSWELAELRQRVEKLEAYIRTIHA